MATGRRFVVTAPIVAQKQMTSTEYDLTFLAPEIAAYARPGQFVELTYGDAYSPLLRRPFSLFEVDREAGTCRVFYRMYGSFTSGLCRLGAGDTVDVLGPLGTPFTWTAGEEARHILIAGGIGAPPIHFLAQELAEEGKREKGKGKSASSDLPAREQARKPDRPDVVVINGARTQDLLVAMREFGDMGVELIAVTEDGTQANKGLVTEVLAGILEAGGGQSAKIYACGPMPMLRAIGEIAIGRGVPCQLSIETSLPCGIGLCQGCAVRVKAEDAEVGFAYALACVDGPVFEASELVWNK